MSLYVFWFSLGLDTWISHAVLSWAVAVYVEFWFLYHHMFIVSADLQSTQFWPSKWILFLLYLQPNIATLHTSAVKFTRLVFFAFCPLSDLTLFVSKFPQLLIDIDNVSFCCYEIYFFILFTFKLMAISSTQSKVQFPSLQKGPNKGQNAKNNAILFK